MPVVTSKKRKESESARKAREAEAEMMDRPVKRGAKAMTGEGARKAPKGPPTLPPVAPFSFFMDGADFTDKIQPVKGYEIEVNKGNRRPETSKPNDIGPLRRELVALLKESKDDRQEVRDVMAKMWTNQYNTTGLRSLVMYFIGGLTVREVKALSHAQCNEMLVATRVPHIVWYAFDAALERHLLRMEENPKAKLLVTPMGELAKRFGTIWLTQEGDSESDRESESEVPVKKLRKGVASQGTDRKLPKVTVRKTFLAAEEEEDAPTRGAPRSILRAQGSRKVSWENTEKSDGEVSDVEEELEDAEMQQAKRESLESGRARARGWGPSTHRSAAGPAADASDDEVDRFLQRQQAREYLMDLEGDSGPSYRASSSSSSGSSTPIQRVRAAARLALKNRLPLDPCSLSTDRLLEVEKQPHKATEQKDLVSGQIKLSVARGEDLCKVVRNLRTLYSGTLNVITMMIEMDCFEQSEILGRLKFLDWLMTQCAVTDPLRHLNFATEFMAANLKCKDWSSKISDGSIAVVNLMLSSGAASTTKLGGFQLSAASGAVPDRGSAGPGSLNTDLGSAGGAKVSNRVGRRNVRKQPGANNSQNSNGGVNQSPAPASPATPAGRGSFGAAASPGGSSARLCNSRKMKSGACTFHPCRFSHTCANSRCAGADHSLSDCPHA